MVMRDGGIAYDGDGEWKYPDWPDWMFKWEFTDQNGMMTYAGGHETGKEEIDFIPTHWVPLPVVGI